MLLVNLDRTEPIILGRGDPIAQLVIQRVERARFVEVDDLPGLTRGAGGYGSTGGFTSGRAAGVECPDRVHPPRKSDH